MQELDAEARQDHAERPDVLDDLKAAADKTGRGAVAAVLAGTIAVGAAGVTPDQVPLPEPVPIVHVVDMGGGIDLTSGEDPTMTIKRLKHYITKNQTVP